MKIPKVRYARFKSKRNFGIELEVNEHCRPNDLVAAIKKIDRDHEVVYSGHYQQDYNNNYWHVKFDRSCSDAKNQGGWEVASYKANGWKDINLMGKVATALISAGAKLNNDCGYHIHVEIADFRTSHAGTLVANWLKIEPVVLEMLPKHRKNNKYAKPLRSRIELPGFSAMQNAAYFWEFARPKRCDTADRRVSLNMCNYSQGTPGRRTVELRLPEGTLDAKEVKNWLRFFLCFVESSRISEFTSDIEAVNLYDTMKLVGLHNEDPFLLLSSALRETKVWFMKRILLYSAKKKLREEAETFLNALEVNPGLIKTDIKNDDEKDEILWSAIYS